MKQITILILVISYSAIVDAKEMILNAAKDKVEQIAFQETVPVGIIDGSVEINVSHGHQKYPTRVIIGLFHGSPRNHAFQVVLEQIEESENKYWLAYEYIKDNKVVIRTDIDSSFELNQKISFQLMWLESKRIQILINDISHQPYVNLESKTPFFSVYSGEAKFEYIFNNINWLENTPPNAENYAPIN